jgi:polyribonucleotide nucleotidyltransferase
VHGSSIFYRGETHVVSVLTLGALDDRKLIGTMENPDAAKRFIHHYNFPPYSVGETGKITGPGRREIGHGALAERALRPLIPERDAFPHTIRLVAEVMSSNGSTSMASVCAGSVALMDGGVPLPRHVAGVAIGLVRESEENYRLLTDIQGPEDAFGDMDCKVAGTREGITALQLDVADTSVRSTIIGEALEAARSARHQILDEMEAAIETPRAALNPNAPTTDTMSIPRDTIGAVIGSGGNTIRDIIDESGVDDISIQDDGKTLITGKQAAVEQAKERVRDIIASSQ